MGVRMDQKEIDQDFKNQKTLDLKTGHGYAVKIKAGLQLEVFVMFDPDDPDQQDDNACLTSADGSYSKTLPIKDGKNVEGGKKLAFSGVKPDQEYSLEIDPGPSGEKYHVFRKVRITEAMLKRAMGGA